MDFRPVQWTHHHCDCVEQQIDGRNGRKHLREQVAGFFSSLSHCMELPIVDWLNSATEHSRNTLYTWCANDHINTNQRGSVKLNKFFFFFLQDAETITFQVILPCAQFICFTLIKKNRLKRIQCSTSCWKIKLMYCRAAGSHHFGTSSQKAVHRGFVFVCVKVFFFLVCSFFWSLWKP